MKISLPEEFIPSIPVYSKRCPNSNKNFSYDTSLLFLTYFWQYFLKDFQIQKMNYLSFCQEQAAFM